MNQPILKMEWNDQPQLVMNPNAFGFALHILKHRACMKTHSGRWCRGFTYLLAKHSFLSAFTTIFRYFCNGYCPTYNALMTSSQDSPKSSKSSRVLNINSRITSPGANTASQWRDPQINSQPPLKWGKSIKAFKSSHYRGRNCRSAQAYCLGSVIGRRAVSTVLGHLHMCGSFKNKVQDLEYSTSLPTKYNWVHNEIWHILDNQFSCQ